MSPSLTNSNSRHLFQWLASHYARKRRRAANDPSLALSLSLLLGSSSTGRQSSSAARCSSERLGWRLRRHTASYPLASNRLSREKREKLAEARRARASAGTVSLKMAAPSRGKKQLVMLWSRAHAASARRQCASPRRNEFSARDSNLAYAPVTPPTQISRTPDARSAAIRGVGSGIYWRKQKVWYTDPFQK